ncbi:MAG: hypothetical protein GXP54_10640 [Deltaproteobacteria bacterium]|nr:hypothetical protein [Deltaproteobacteria bacterium]
MTIEEAINTAIEYETRVQGVYAEAESAEKDATAKEVLGTLAREEKFHIDYLEKRRAEWLKNGTVTPEALETALPSPEKIREGVSRLKANLDGQNQDHRASLETLQKCLKVEEETSAFYQKMVDTLPGDARKMFARFLEIEEGHQAFVAAEIDAVQGLGYWFDFKEFDLEAG